MSDDPAQRLVVAARTALRLARSAPSGTLALTRLADGLSAVGWWPDDPGLGRELAQARERATEPLGAKVVERQLRGAWGERPGAVLDDLDPEPVAVTPLAQVHRAALDGATVAVKVLRPGLAAGVRQDLQLLDGLAGPLRAALPGLDVAAMLAEVRERVLDELDLESEAEAQRRVARSLRSHPAFTAPAPVMRLCNPQVVVSEWVDGTPLDRVAERDRACALLVAFVLGGAPFGLMHVGARPQDALLLDDGRLAVLDFGAVAPVAAARSRATLALLDALAGDDEHGFSGALETLGILPAALGPAAFAFVRTTLGRLAAGPARLDERALGEVRTRAEAQGDEAVRLITAIRLAPEDLWPLLGAAQAFTAVVAAGGASGDWLALARAALRDGWATDAEPR